MDKDEDDEEAPSCSLMENLPRAWPCPVGPKAEGAGGAGTGREDDVCAHGLQYGC